jgi:hypothetical protein
LVVPVLGDPPERASPNISIILLHGKVAYAEENQDGRDKDDKQGRKTGPIEGIM